MEKAKFLATPTNMVLLPETLWPSGLRRWLKAPFRKGVGSNPTGVIFTKLPDSVLLLNQHMCDIENLRIEAAVQVFWELLVIPRDPIVEDGES